MLVKLNLRSVLRTQFRKLPPVAKRDRTIAKLKAEIKQAEVSKPDISPSIHFEINRANRQLSQYKTADNNWSAFAGFTLSKPGVRELAERLGLNLPTLYGTWNSLDDIPWNDLPDAIVIKSHRGSNGRGVLPLIRHENGWKLANRDSPQNLEELLSPIRAHLKKKRVEAPFLVEQFLGTGSDFSIPNDVKIYVFYGQPVLVLVRKVFDHYESITDHRARLFNMRGEDVTNIDVPWILDESISRPEKFNELIKHATDISLATRLPFVRVDLYEIDGVPYFGEITPRPGTLVKRSHGSLWDRYLGECFEAAEIRVNADIAKGFINTSGPVVRTGQTPIQESLLTPPG